MPRPNKPAGSGAGRSGVHRDPTSYTDYDEAMDDGVDLEEKGERFQVGSKAQRFYEQALKLYLRAAQLAPAQRPPLGSTEHKAADALYNASRIQFLLGTQFYLVEENAISIAESIVTSTQALYMLNLPPLPNADDESSHNLADPFMLDILSARATAQQCLGDLIDELGYWPSNTQTLLGPCPRPLPNFDGHEVTKLFTPTKLWITAQEQFYQLAEAQHRILCDLHKSNDSASATDVKTTQEPAPADDVEMIGAGADDVYGYTASLVTRGTELDSLLYTLSCINSLLQSARHMEHVVEWSDRFHAMISLAMLFFEDPTLPPFAGAKDEMAKSLEFKRIQVVLQCTRVSKVADLYITGSVKVSDKGLQVKEQTWETMSELQNWATELLAPPNPSDMRMVIASRQDVPSLCDHSEAAESLCRVALKLVDTDLLDFDLATAIWKLATSSTKLYLAALALLDNSSASSGAVLGQANISTPTSRSKCRILMALSALSIFRSHPVFEAVGIQGARGMRSKLIDNARLYGRKAVAQIGLSWFYGAAVITSPPALPDGGWDSLTLQAESTFVLFRALLHRYNVAKFTGGTVLAQAELEVTSAVAQISALQHMPVSSTDNGTIAFKVYRLGMRAWLQQQLADDGINLTAEEQLWWHRDVFGPLHLTPDT